MLRSTMNDLIPIKVECHSGYKADEYPTSFYWDKVRFDIKEIQDRWYQGDRNPDWPPANYFKVITTKNQHFLLKHDVKTDRWYLVVKGERLNLQV